MTDASKCAEKEKNHPIVTSETIRFLLTAFERVKQIIVQMNLIFKFEPTFKRFTLY